jgi:hypothetical protein
MAPLLLAILFNSITFAGPRLEAACMKQMSSEPQRQSICQCLQLNLQRKTKPAELALLADVYEGKAVAAKKLQKKEFIALAQMDTKVAEACAANPDWKMGAAANSGTKKKK